jgi:hypothetical protein
VHATVLLADEVGTIDAKVAAKGLGLAVVDPGTTSIGIVFAIHVGGNEMGRRFDFVLELIDADGQPVLNANGSPYRLAGSNFVATLHEGLPDGSPGLFTLPLTATDLPLAPGERYEWRVTIGDEQRDDWRASFYVREKKG